MRLITYNLGHGFYDRSYIKGQKPLKNNIINNIIGATKIINDIDADIVLLQETHKKGIFPYNVSYNKMLCNTKYNNIYLSNRNTILINIGNSILIKRKDYKVKKISYNHKLKGFYNNFFCQNKNYIKISFNNYVIYNVHLSPYKKNENIRKMQLEYLFNDAKLEITKGHKTIIGGDFNMNIRNGISYLPDEMVLVMSKDNTNRSLDKPNDIASHCTLDGFIITKNIKINNIYSLNNYEYSDHTPVVLDFD